MVNVLLSNYSAEESYGHLNVFKIEDCHRWLLLIVEMQLKDLPSCQKLWSGFNFQYLDKRQKTGSLCCKEAKSELSKSSPRVLVAWVADLEQICTLRGSRENVLRGACGGLPVVLGFPTSRQHLVCWYSPVVSPDPKGSTLWGWFLQGYNTALCNPSSQLSDSQYRPATTGNVFLWSGRKKE